MKLASVVLFLLFVCGGAFAQETSETPQAAPSTPEATQPAPTAPEAAKPEAAPPPEAAQPEAAKPETTPPPEAAQPEAAKPETAPPPEAAQPEAAKPETAPPPEAAQPMPSAPKGAEKMTAEPGDSVSVTEYYKQNVYDTSDNTIGEVSDVLLDKDGHVTAVILSVGGFLGLGAKYVSVPFNALRITEKDGKRYLVMDATKEALTSAPGYQYDKTTGKWVPESK